MIIFIKYEPQCPVHKYASKIKNKQNIFFFKAIQIRCRGYVLNGPFVQPNGDAGRPLHDKTKCAVSKHN